MKKLKSALICLLFVFVSLLPLGKTLSACFGYTFELLSYSAFSFITALLSVCLLVLNVKYHETVSPFFAVLVCLLSPLSLINGLFYIAQSKSVWVIISVCVCVGCCCYLTSKLGRPFALNIISFILSSLVVLPVCFLIFLSVIFGGIRKDTVVRSVDSPNGIYRAEIIESNQGAMGGNTIVEVHETHELNGLVFKIRKKPQTVYLGDWGEFENMNIYWKSDTRLVIDTSQYEIE